MVLGIGRAGLIDWAGLMRVNCAGTQRAGRGRGVTLKPYVRSD
jgi:hypothetical protein